MEYEKSVLDNGLRVVTLANPHARSVTLGLTVEAGTSVEGSGQRGLAHLVEHMIFQGTSNRDGLEISRMMDGAGGRIGGFTSRDYTCYFAQVLADYVPYALDLLGDLLLNPVFEEGALEREKRAILCEWQAARDNPSQRVHELMRSALWPDHALGRSILGDGDSLASMNREDLIYFLHSHYQPNRMVMAAAGRLRHDDFVAQVRDAFWRLIGERDATPRQPPVSVPALSLAPAPVSQTYFSWGIEAPPFASRQRSTVHLMDQILGAGISSRLFTTLRERHGLVYDVGSTYDAWRDSGILSIEGSTSSEQLPFAVELILDELKGILQGGDDPIRDDELHRAKIRLASQIRLGAEDTHTLMSRLATQELYFGRYLPENEILQSIERIDLPTLHRWIEEGLGPAIGTSSLAVLGDVEPHVSALQSSLQDAHDRASANSLMVDPAAEPSQPLESAPWD